MCIYCTTDNYRKIYENHVGPIAREASGRSYEIHHIDGDHSNNDPKNLTAVTLKEHYDIHFKQRDYGACRLMAGKLEMDPEEYRELMRLSANKRVEDGTHNWKSDVHSENSAQRELEKVALGIHPLQTRPDGTSFQKDRVLDGSHNFLGTSEIARNRALKRAQNGTHPFLADSDGTSLSSQRVEDGSHNFLHPKAWACPCCGQEGKGTGNYNRHVGSKACLRNQEINNLVSNEL